MFEIYTFENKKYHDLNPVCMGREDCAPHHSFGPAIRKNYLIHFCLKGRGVLYAPGGTYRVSAGQLFLIRPGEINTYTADPDEPWEYIWIEFCGAAAQRLSEIKNPVTDCDETIFMNMWEQRKRAEFREERIISSLYLLLPTLFENNAGIATAEKIKGYILLNYMNDIKIDALAKDMGYSRQHISREFKRASGMTIRSYLTKVRLKNAKKILRRGFSVAQTALMCGYNDTFNFSKAFKGEFGINPSDWKKSRGEEKNGENILII